MSKDRDTRQRELFKLLAGIEQRIEKLEGAMRARRATEGTSDGPPPATS